MADFYLKDSVKNELSRNYACLLSFLALYCLPETIVQQRKYPYEKYEDFYFANLDLFTNIPAEVDHIIKRKKEDKNFSKTLEDFKFIAKEFYERIILNKTGTKESIIQVISVLFIIPFIVACITSFGYKFYSLAAIFFFLTSLFFMFFSIATSKRKILLGKEKNPKRQILFFPGKIKFVFSQLENLLNKLNKGNEQEVFESEEIEVLEFLVQEGQLEKKNGKYYLLGPVKSFLKWLEEHPVYEIKNKLICKKILQTNGTKITTNTIYSAKSRNKDEQKEYLD